MTWRRAFPLLLLLSGCAHLAATPNDSLERRELWDEAHGYFASSDFQRADSVFALMTEQYPDTNEGREALFYRGVMSLDPRNPGWNPEPAEEHLERYLAADTEEGLIHRRPEGEVLHQLAHQLNIPMEERIQGLQTPPQTRTVVVRAQEAQGTVQENERLRRELAASQQQVQTLRDELERIRKTLTGGTGNREE